MLEKTILRSSRVFGCLVGGALGDALGYPVEFLHYAGIVDKYGPKGIQEPPDPALYTDDTQMTVRVAEGLLIHVGETVPDWDEIFGETSEAVADQLIEWMEKDPERAPGASCIEGCKRIARRKLEIEQYGASDVIPLYDCGRANSKGCGAVMRSAPYGMIIKDIQNAEEYAGEHALMTHRHDAAQASAAGLAAGINRLVLGFNHIQAALAMIEAAEKYDRGTGMMLRESMTFALSELGLIDQQHLLSERWKGWTGDEALAAALYCFLFWATCNRRDPVDRFKAAVRLAVNTSGDSDSVGSICGNLMGAWAGQEAIPADWFNRLENRFKLKDLAERISNVPW